MALQGSGQISLSNITGEMGIINSNVSLVGLSTHSTLNDQSPSKPNEAAPHGIGEFYLYDHSYSNFKALVGGPQNPTYSGKWFDFCEDQTRIFYAHDGAKDEIQIGDMIYLNDGRGGYYPVESHYIKMENPNFTHAIIVRTNMGKVIDIDSCAGIDFGDDPREPGVGTPDDTGGGPSEYPGRR